ncbi:MAG: Ppx/GppA phosphatase family protein [Candidatus Scalindua sp.]|jgi:exopolyphosphatase/guanosine-5'-triphosphate,3'-diphosphate pyrophosphatase|nr:Ppx/GppA phosphatase family protein [Candidatus Scalindua sp.]MDV5167031.1 Ppx/GppA phosphatase family protein [Candidatus Scalindua sp.]
MLKASIDLGTNTCLMLVAEVESGYVKNVLGDYARIVRLGEGVDKTRCLQSDAIERTLTCLNEYRKTISTAGISPDDVICVATSQARDAENGSEFFAKVEADLGFVFRVVSGMDEALLSFKGSLLPNMEASNHAVVDIGGGSTEFVTVNESRSLDLGSVRFTERYLSSDPVIDEEFSVCLNEIDNKLEELIDWRSTIPAKMQMLAVAGTATTLASWHLRLREFNAAEVEKVQLTSGDLLRMVKDLKRMTVKERCDQTGIDPKRADVLLAGAMILWRTMEKLKFPTSNISSRGLRYGVLMNL